MELQLLGHSWMRSSQKARNQHIRQILLLRLAFYVCQQALTLTWLEERVLELVPADIAVAVEVHRTHDVVHLIDDDSTAASSI